MENKRKIIKTAGLSKRLLNRGHYVCDLKPKTENPTESCCIFFVDDWLKEDLDQIMQNKYISDRTVIDNRLKMLNLTEIQYKRKIMESYLDFVGC